MEIVIVGHGLAGAVLSQTFLEKGAQVTVLEANLPNSASQVSAGLINPLIGPKLNIPLGFHDCMVENQKFFHKLEKKVGQTFLEPIELLRVFSSKSQHNRWQSLASPYQLGLLNDSDGREMGIDCPFGLGKTSAWFLHSEKFIEYSRHAHLSNNSYQEIAFFPEHWEGYPVVFCDGFRAFQNPWFKTLPFAPAQGEVIKIESHCKYNISNGTWHLRDRLSGTAKIGSTWKHQNIEDGPSIHARLEILKKSTFLPELNERKVLEHNAGVRSGTRDRHPILGRHPENANYYIFNGFGSRGCTTIAKSAREFVDFIMDGTPLPNHKNLLRFSKS